VNGDGKADAAFLTYHSDTGKSQLRTYLGNGTGGFAAAGTPMDAGDTGVALGDLNGDHKLDAVVVDYNSNSVAADLGDGKGTLTKHGSGFTLRSGSQPDVR
jgi:hypothetical protein